MNRPAVRIALGAGLLVALVCTVGGRSFVDGVRAVDLPAVLAALGLGVLTTVLSAGRWCLVARALGLALPLRTAIADYYRAALLNSVLPAGVLGDVHRAVAHGRTQGDVARGVRAVVIERAVGQVVLIAAGALALLVSPAAAPVRGIVVVALAVVGVLAVVLLLTRPPRVLADLRAARAALPAALGLSAAALAGHLTLFVVAARTAGVTAPLATVAPLVVLSLLAMGLPLNVGGWGLREGVAALLFGTAGLGASVGLATSVVYGVLALIATLPGAAVLVARVATGSRAPARGWRLVSAPRLS